MGRNNNLEIFSSLDSFSDLARNYAIVSIALLRNHSRKFKKEKNHEKYNVIYIYHKVIFKKTSHFQNLRRAIIQQ